PDCRHHPGDGDALDVISGKSVRVAAEGRSTLLRLRGSFRMYLRLCRERGCDGQIPGQFWCTAGRRAVVRPSPIIGSRPGSLLRCNTAGFSSLWPNLHRGRQIRAVSMVAPCCASLSIFQSRVDYMKRPLKYLASAAMLL